MPTVLRDLPEVEYINGKPYPKVSPKRTHARVQFALAKILDRCGGLHGEVNPEWRLHLEAGTSLVPDLAYVSYQRLQRLSKEEAEEPPFAPEVVAEIRSPSHRRALTEEKIRLYLAHGAHLVLDVDPSKRLIYAHTHNGVSMHHAGERFSSLIVPWLEFDVDEVFAKIDIPR
jgi:Uma2 family endonuclease